MKVVFCSIVVFASYLFYFITFVVNVARLLWPRPWDGSDEERSFRLVVSEVFVEISSFLLLLSMVTFPTVGLKKKPSLLQKREGENLKYFVLNTTSR